MTAQALLMSLGDSYCYGQISLQIKYPLSKTYLNGTNMQAGVYELLLQSETVMVKPWQKNMGGG